MKDVWRSCENCNNPFLSKKNKKLCSVCDLILKGINPPQPVISIKSFMIEKVKKIKEAKNNG